MIWLSDHDWNIWKEGCVSSLLQGDTESKRLLRDRRAAGLKGKWNMCCSCRGFRGSVLSCLLPATTQTSLSIPIDPTSAAVMFHLEWLELCDLLCSSPLPFELSFVSLCFWSNKMIFVMHVSVSAGLGLVEEKPFMTGYDYTLCLSALTEN